MIRFDTKHLCVNTSPFIIGHLHTKTIKKDCKLQTSTMTPVKSSGWPFPKWKWKVVRYKKVCHMARWCHVTVLNQVAPWCDIVVSHDTVMLCETVISHDTMMSRCHGVTWRSRDAVHSKNDGHSEARRTYECYAFRAPSGCTKRTGSFFFKLCYGIWYFITRVYYFYDHVCDS